MKRPQKKQSRSQRVAVGRPRSRVRQGRRWMLSGWTLFAASMFLPALWIGFVGWWKGWECALLALTALWAWLHHDHQIVMGAYLIAFGLANIIMLLSPLMLRSRKWSRPARLTGNALLLLSCLQVTSWFFNILLGSSPGVSGIGVGYYVWLAGFWTVFAGVLRLQSNPQAVTNKSATAMPTTEQERRAEREARRELHEHLHI